MNAQTPMLRQYFEIRGQNPGVLLAMRVGDFYEFYGPDAEAAAGALEIALTGREDGSNGRVAMAGVPFHSIEKYLARLLAKGHRVALCEQMEDPKQAKGLIRRGVARVLTPGTVVEDAMLSSGASNYLGALVRVEGRIGLAFLESSTGEFVATEMAGEGATDRLLQELARMRPAELLVAPDLSEYGELARGGLGASVVEASAPKGAAARLLRHFAVTSLAGFGLEEKPAAVAAAAAVLEYAARAHPSLAHVDAVATYAVGDLMLIDPATRRSLEIAQNLGDGSKRHTLLSVMDECATPMGTRLLRRWLEGPLLDRGAIATRHDAVAGFAVSGILRGDLREALKRAGDMERLVGRAATGLASPRDLGALRGSLAALPAILDPLGRLATGRIQALVEAIGSHDDLADLLGKALVADPPPVARDGGVIRAGHDLELDALREIGRDGKAYIASLEAAERAATGIAGLKVGFNSVFGYYLEVAKAHQAKVPAHYVRKQTTAGAERYITADLKEHEAKVLGAEEKALALEADLFARLRGRVAALAPALLATARALAETDALATFAEVAGKRGYVRPEMVERDALCIEGGRHPVVEVASVAQGGFVPNDLSLEDTRCVVLTGPNMAGKSTYLRQTALIALLAQCGSYVPARSATLGVCDRIFARIGAKDELALGQSTFMVEMVESANILNHATPRSLVILDEVGRGTSTFDGLAIAWAMVEHLAGVGAKTLFATHYHQLNALAGSLAGVANFRVAVEEVGEGIVWTHRVLPGGADRSYGIHVARMAGVPAGVLARAREVLGDLESRDAAGPRAVPTKRASLQLTLFEAEEPEVVRRLRELDPDALTPMQALQLVGEWKRGLR